MGGAKERSHDIGGGRGRLRTEVEEGSWREKSGKTTLASVAALCSLSTQPPAVVASPQLFMSSTLLSPHLALCWRVERGALSLSLLVFSSFRPFLFLEAMAEKAATEAQGRAKGPTDGRRAEKEKERKKELHLPYRSAAFALFYYCPRRLREKKET